MSDKDLPSQPRSDEALRIDPRLPAALALGWVLPGAGHFLLGRRLRGILFAVLIFASLAVGVSLEGKLFKVEPDQPLSVLGTLGSMGMGAPYFVLRWGAGYEGQVVAPGYEYGGAFILTAGLMNLLLMLDIWDIGRGSKE